MSHWYRIGLTLIAAIVAFEVYSQHAQKIAYLEASIVLAESQTAALTSQYDALQKEKEATEHAWASAPALWTSNDDTAPYGGAQATLASLAVENGATLKGFQTGGDQDLGGLTAMRMTLELEADTETWQKLLQGIHQNSPTILPLSAQLRRINRTSENETYPATLIRLTVDLPYTASGANQ